MGDLSSESERGRKIALVGVCGAHKREMGEGPARASFLFSL